jgi:nitroreductase
MDALRAILTRRSIRKYTDKQVSDETVLMLLKAAMSAPSSKNLQPWYFVVIRNRELLAKVPEFHPYADMLPQAALGILICGDAQKSAQEVWVQDCSAATQNLLLAAHALGLGAVWLGVYPRQERVRGMRQLVNLPQHIHPLALVAIGYPAEQKPPASERFSLDKVFLDRWGVPYQKQKATDK